MKVAHRSLTNNPLGVSMTPRLVSDPAREQELLRKFISKVRYIVDNYRWCSAIAAASVSINQSLDMVRSALATGTPIDLDALHPDVGGFLIGLALKNAGKREGALQTGFSDADLEAAARMLDEKAKPLRGRPSSNLLRHHIEARMALIQEYCGKPVVLAIERNSVYDPGAVDPMGELLLSLAMHMEPSATATQIATIVKKARARHAGKAMRFQDYCPLYGHRVIVH